MVPSSEQEFISEYDEEPYTPGWVKPMTQTKRKLFQELARLEPYSENEASSAMV